MPLFQTQDFIPQIDLRALLHADDPHIDPPIVSLATDFEVNGAGELLQHFLDKVHIYNPILDEEKVRQYMRDAGLNDLGWNATSCLLLLVYAISSIASSTEATPSENSSSSRQSPVFQQSEAFFYAAQKQMGILLCKSGILKAQCFFLVGVYLMTTFRIVEAWKAFVQALACYQSLPNPKYVNETQYEDESQLQQSKVGPVSSRSCGELRLELNIAKNSVWDLTYPSYFPP